MSSLGFKARVGCLICIMDVTVMYISVRSICGATPADLFDSQPPAQLPQIILYHSGGCIYFLAAVEWLFDQREEFEDEMRRLQKEGIWRWVLMKESPDKYYKNDQTLIYAFKVLK